MCWKSFWPFDTLLVYLGNNREIWKCIQFLLKCLNLNSQGNAKNNLNIFIFPRIKSLNNNNWKQSSFLILMLYSHGISIARHFRAKNLNCQRRRLRELSIDIDWKATFKIHLVCAILNKALKSSKVMILFWV